MHQLFVALAALPVILLLDFIWLGNLAKPIYQRHIGSLLGEPRWAAAALVYLLLVTGIVLFVLPHCKSTWQALLWGGLFGAITYGIYDFTNLAILKNWNWAISLIDLAWGVFVCALTTVAAMHIDKLLR